MCHPQCTVYIRRGEKQPVNGSWPVMWWECDSLYPRISSFAFPWWLIHSSSSHLWANQRPCWGVLTNQRPVCCQQVPGLLSVWEYRPRFSVVTSAASQAGMMKSNILKWGYIFQNSSTEWNQSSSCILCISYPLTFVTLIGFVAWILQLSNVWYIHCLRRRSKSLMHICRQMSRISCIFLFNQTF